MLTNRTQSQVSISGLTYNNLIEDAYNAIKDSEEFRNSFSTFNSNEAARMIIELYAYVATQLATRMDQMGNELFVDTASSYGLSRLLKLVGAQVDFPAAASCEVEVSTAATTNTIHLSYGIDNENSLELSPVSESSFKYVTCNNGSNSPWEFIKKEVGEGGEYVYDYTAKYDFSAPSQKYTLHEGRTHSYEYTIRTINPVIIGSDVLIGSVIKDSVRVYYKQKVLSAGTDNSYEIKEFKKVENFFTVEALTATTGVFTERNMGGGRCELCLKPYYNADTQESDIGKELLIMYRTGGGSDGNIAIGSISKTERFDTLGPDGRVTGVGELTITNITTGIGGKDELTTDEIRSIVVNEVRNTKIAITEEDYEYLLPKYDSSIALLKCYGEKNEETADLASTYGYYANPIAAWLIILKQNKEFYDAYLNGDAGLTDRINDIAFNTLDINPRFDEQYQVNMASVNQYFKATELGEYYTEESRQYAFPVDVRGLEVLANGGAKVTVTVAPYVDSAIESRRGANYFKRYDNDDVDSITWAELLTKEANVGDVYIISDEDPYGTINDRWICNIAVPTGGAGADYEDYWSRVDFDYVWDNLVSDGSNKDHMYVEQDIDTLTNFTTVSSYLSNSFSASWQDIVEHYSSGETPTYVDLTDVVLVIDGITIDLGDSASGGEFHSLTELVEYINSQVSPVVYKLSLKDNIAPLSITNPSEVLIQSNELFVPGPSTMQLKLKSGGSAINLDVDTSSITTYGQLCDAINDAIAVQHLEDKFRAVFYQNGGDSMCWDLWIICGEEFSYRDSSTSGASAIYRYMLDHPDITDWIDCELYEIDDPDLATEWEEYLTSKGDPIVTEHNGYLELTFGDDEITTLQILGDNAGWMRSAFGFGPIEDTEKTQKAKRDITVNYVESVDGNSANVIVNMTSEFDLLNSDIYINIFGTPDQEIILGSYYENVEKYLPSNTSQVIIDLLKRGPIKALYSTSYIVTEDSDNLKPIIDKYGCSYQLKFSTGLVEEQTFSELSSGNSPAYVDTTKASYDTLRMFDSNEILYMKVDGMEYDGNGSFTLGNEVYPVEEEKGYAKFNMSWFNSYTVLDFIGAVVKTFEAQGIDGAPLLDSYTIEGDCLRLFTRSTAFYSSISFGNTSQTITSYLFGVNDVIVPSKEGQIDVKQINYSFFSLTNYPAIGKSMHMRYIDKGGNTKEDDVLIGYSIVQFANNVNNSNVKDYIVVDNNRIILADLSNGANMTISFDWEDQIGKLAWQKMFTSLSWEEDLHITDNYELTSDTEIVPGKVYYVKDGDDYVVVGKPDASHLYMYYEYVGGAAYGEFTNMGDYYISLDTVLEEDNSIRNVYTLRVESPERFPLGNVYAHMYEDYSFNHIVSQDEDTVTYTDEYNWNRLMKDKRVMLTEHIYKQPRFIPFDLAITCRLPNSETFSQTDYDAELRRFLRTEYGIYSNNIGKEILPDEIILNIKNTFSKIANISVDYLGYDMLSETTNKTKLKTKFNQQHIIASDEVSLEPVINEQTKLFSYETVTKHGLRINLKYGA